MENNNDDKISLRNCFAYPQKKLLEALDEQNISKFRAALLIGANPLSNDNMFLTVFEKALETPGCCEYIKECLQHGCNPNYRNKCNDKPAIYFAIDSQDPDNLNELLKSPKINVNIRYNETTPLITLAKKINKLNANNISKCIYQLLEQGASPNVTDEHNRTPLYYITRNMNIDDNIKMNLIENFVSLDNIDIDKYGNGDLRNYLIEKYPQLKLPPNNKQLASEVINMLEIENIDNYSDDDKTQLFLQAIQAKDNSKFSFLLQNGVYYNKRINGYTPIELAWNCRNHYAFVRLLQMPNVTISLSCIDGGHTEFMHKIYSLIETGLIKINDCSFYDSSLLHEAVRHNDKHAIKELLKRGANLYVENVNNELALSGIPPALLEEHLDYCISSNSELSGSKDFEITIDFKNFHNNKCKPVLAPIQYIAKSPEYRYLLKHPVITSLLYLKWHKLSFIFYINFIMFILYALSITTHIVCKFRETQYDTIKDISLHFTYIGIIYLVLREFLQFISTPLKYLKSFPNYLELLLIILSIITCLKSTIFDLEFQLNIAVICLLLLSYEFILLIGSLPFNSISTYILMLQAVCKSFIKFFLFYSIFIIIFTLCFYIKCGSNVATNNNEEYFHRFPNPLIAFTKIMVMFTGEFEAPNLKPNSFSSYLLFLSFVFFMTMVLFNLLNGLAVSDTQTIKAQTELNVLICRSNVLYRYEKLAYEQIFKIGKLLNRTFLAKLFTICDTEFKINIFPYDKNRLVIHNERINTLYENECNNFSKAKLSKFYFYGLTSPCTKIAKRIVGDAIAVLEKKSYEQHKQLFEENIETLMEKLNNIQSDLWNVRSYLYKNKL